jgi:hypothetical protein
LGELDSTIGDLRARRDPRSVVADARSLGELKPTIGNLRTRGNPLAAVGIDRRRRRGEERQRSHEEQGEQT